VTKVVGVEDFLIDPGQLAAELRVLLAGSTTIEVWSFV
jgi:translation initiation factor 1 (eIF-1/SUI1)